MKEKEYSLNIINTFFILIFCWFIIIGAFLVWAINNEKESVYEYAANEARAGFNKDVIYRHWSAIHGGTYVPITKKTSPNPYLNHITERDISTPSGKKLTLVNPAYMTRQVHELGKEKYGTKGHITSLNPIRPENKPDDWEAESLKSFEKGSTETFAVKKFEGAEYLRLMRPLTVNKNCLKCHAKQGYVDGDIRGGISISIPLAPYKLVSFKKIKKLVIAHGLVALLGMIGLFFGGFLMNRKELDRTLAIKGLIESEEKHRKILDAMKDDIYICSSDLVLEYMNPAMVKRIGRDATGEFCYKTIYNRGEVCSWCIFKKVEKNETITYELENPQDKKNYRITNIPISDIKGNISKLTVARDITERKRYEKALKEEKTKLENALNKIKTLSGLLPICASCKKIRDDKGYWNILESYIQKNSEAQFSHSICPDCSEKLYGEEDWYKK